MKTVIPHLNGISPKSQSAIDTFIDNIADRDRVLTNWRDAIRSLYQEPKSTYASWFYYWAYTHIQVGDRWLSTQGFDRGHHLTTIASVRDVREIERWNGRSESVVIEPDTVISIAK